MSHVVSRRLIYAFLVVSFLGFLDATYLTVQHYRGQSPRCTLIHGCDVVTTSQYATWGPVPVSLVGSLYYLIIFLLSFASLDRRDDRLLESVARLSFFGFLASFYFVYLQIFVIRAICIYCLFSAATSTFLFILSSIFLYITRSRR